MKLNCCKADYHTVPRVVFVDAKSGELITVTDCVMLKSYNSVVCGYDQANDHMYMLPRSGYSNTTHKHVRKFIEKMGARFVGYRQRAESDAYTICSEFSFFDGSFHRW